LAEPGLAGARLAGMRWREPALQKEQTYRPGSASAYGSGLIDRAALGRHGKGGPRFSFGNSSRFPEAKHLSPGPAGPTLDSAHLDPVALPTNPGRQPGTRKSTALHRMGAIVEQPARSCAASTPPGLGRYQHDYAPLRPGRFDDGSDPLRYVLGRCNAWDPTLLPSPLQSAPPPQSFVSHPAECSS
jgi:hypothetical protein